ncbi:hypothetical protein [Spongiactinospora sp. TRM90649]|uniref:hypothetical protein n=1 Tax=Spongiactinospora sp. TRM90649 TaxID=3031114 RepID=UPI0023F97DDC|nr:hypothetical protein [Spongiactinospora sp. TRM90649]MDF5753836.1 hypothetical protein [Spongiactinospora sp. TRM90649]
MIWVVAAVAAAFTGVAVIAVLSVKVLVAARGLHRELERTRSRLTPKRDKLRQKIDVIRNPE